MISAAVGTVFGLQSTDASATGGPYLRLYRNSASPAANDVIGNIIFRGKDSLGNDTDYFTIVPSILSPTDGAENGQMEFKLLVAGATVTAFTVANGMTLGAPTGGLKGTGTLNAVGVYDDNVLLTCYVLEAEREGKIDPAAWDARVANYVIPAVIEKVITRPEVREDVFADAVSSDGKPVLETVEIGGEPVTRQAKVKVGDRVLQPAEFELVEREAAREIERLHEPARKFAAERMDDLDPAVFTAKWRETGVLPGMPTPEQWAADGPQSTGQMVQKLWELCELQAVHIGRLTDRVAALEARAP
jgi:hypothetical protein